jgi:hypothetical protein
MQTGGQAWLQCIDMLRTAILVDQVDGQPEQGSLTRVAVDAEA